MAKGTVMIKGAIFDMDGTLLDSMPVWEHASERYLARKGIVAEKNLSEILFSMSMREGATYVKEKYGLTEAVDVIIDGVNSIVYGAYERDVQPKSCVEEFLRQLKEAGVPMVVATSSDRKMAEVAFERIGFLPYFKKIFTCNEVGAGKSKPDIYFAAAECLGTKPEETWVFEDALYAIETAKKAGFRTVGLFDATSAKDQKQIQAIADVYAKRWNGATMGAKRNGECI